MTLWIALGALSLIAIGFVVWPLYRKSGQLTPMLMGIIVVTVGLSAGLYHFIGSPNVSSGAGSLPDIDEVVESLEKRLEQTPDDVNGWLTLGRSYQTMKRFDDAIEAFEKAISLERGQNAETLVALAIVLMEQQDGQISDRSTSLFENALALQPNNPNALFYAGGAAAQRGNTALAADRWEMLLQQNAPPEIQELLQRKINEWRGLPPPTAVQAVEQAAELLTVRLSVSDAAAAELPADATVFVIARDPAQPSPPIAVSPQRLAALPLVISLSDANAMVPGRPLSGFAELELVARVSLSGQPMAQSGDWFGSLVVASDTTETIDLVIDQKTP
jgi:cytochrome c-type biogenesis protein CcmH